MNGPIVQAVALCIFGNHYLRHGGTFDIWPGSKVFQFCKSVGFVDWVRREEIAFAPDPAAWLERLREDGITVLLLRHEPTAEPKAPDHKLAGMVGGGGRWLIEAQGLNWSDYWVPRWTVGDRKDPERKIWNVTYGRIAKTRPPSGANDLPMDRLNASFSELLPELAGFADSHDLGEYAATFRAAAATLTAADPLAETYHSDLARCPLLLLPAQRLLAAAQRAWVFGGMGSWNDLGFDGDEQRRYDDLSEHLYMLVVAAICSATNSTNPGHAAKGVIVPPVTPLPPPPPTGPAQRAPEREPKAWWRRVFGGG